MEMGAKAKAAAARLSVLSRFESDLISLGFFASADSGIGKLPCRGPRGEPGRLEDWLVVDGGGSGRGLKARLRELGHESWALKALSTMGLSSGAAPREPGVFDLDRVKPAGRSELDAALNAALAAFDAERALYLSSLPARSEQLREARAAFAGQKALARSTMLGWLASGEARAGRPYGPKGHRRPVLESQSKRRRLLC